MTSARSRRRRHAMAQKIAAFVLALVAPIAAADPGSSASQPAEPPTASKIADARTESPDNAPSQQQPAAAPEAVRPDAAEVEILRRFNDLRRELLNDRAKVVDRWLAVTAIFLTLLGIIAPVAGYFGFKRLRYIETEARRNAEKARGNAEIAQEFVAKIKANYDESTSILEKLTAEDADKDPDRTKKAAESVQEDPTASPISQAIAAAVLLQQKGDIEKAIEKWHAIANVVDGIDKEKKTGSQAWFSIGYLLYRDKINDLELEKVIDAYDEAIWLKPDLSEAYNNRGVAKNDIGRYKEALADYDKALRLNPNDAEVYNNRGAAKNSLDRHEEALADYDKAIRLKPKYANAYNNRGNAKADLGRHEEALADYDEAIRLKPDLSEAYNHRGVTNALLNRTYEARRDFEIAISFARNEGDEALAKEAECALKILSGEQDP